MSDAAAIVVTDLVKVFDDDARALDDVSLIVDRGELVVIAGPSGSGKSTLLHLIGALDEPTSGSIVVHGRTLRRRHLDAYRRDEVGLVFQMHNLLPHLSAAQNVEIAMLGTHTPRAERERRALALLDEVGLARFGAVTPPKLSGGERQRVAVARALANRPALLLADEPTGSLDSDATHAVVELLRRRRDDHGVTVVVVSHDPIVISAADRVVWLVDGRIPDQSIGAVALEPR